MSALTFGRKTPSFPGYVYAPMPAYQMSPGTGRLYMGGLVGLNSSGLLVKMAAATTGLKCTGVAWNQYGALPPDSGEFSNSNSTAVTGSFGLDRAALYGGSALLGSLTVICTVNGNASTTTFSSTLATKAALLAAINTAINTACSTSGVVYATQAGGGGLKIDSLSNTGTVSVGAGTANVLLGLSTGSGNCLIQCRRGVQFFANSSAYPCLVSELYQPVYCEDDQTCQGVAGGGVTTTSIVGVLLAIADGTLPGDTQYGPGVWVDAGTPVTAPNSIAGFTITAPTATGQVLTATSATAAHFA